jgi:hypothetical protein
MSSPSRSIGMINRAHGNESYQGKDCRNSSSVPNKKSSLLTIGCCEAQGFPVEKSQILV